ncbi:MAG: GNAT family N-acetyltransferase [Hespellia sp.]|nr:GNAT family N-acetyltransferase [Hespellia sp.]
MKLTKAAPEQFSTINTIFQDSFPPEELLPVDKMQQLLENGTLELLAITDAEHHGNMALGGIIVLTHTKKTLWFLFAVAKEYRLHGIGQKIIDLVKERYGTDGFFGEVEIPDKNASETDLRVRRRNFYIRNGLKPTGIPITMNGIPLELFTYHSEISAGEYLDFYHAVFGEEYTKRIFNIEIIETE